MIVASGHGASKVESVDVVFACASCGVQSEKKSERCPECGAATHGRCAQKDTFAAHARKHPGAYRRPTSRVSWVA